MAWVKIAGFPIVSKAGHHQQTLAQTINAMGQLMKFDKVFL